MDAQHNELSNGEIIERLNALELRMSQLESGYQIESSNNDYQEASNLIEQDEKINDGSLIESKIGESGLAWLGNIVLFFGIIFIEQYIQKSGYQLTAPIFGYAAVAAILVMAHYLKRSYPTMASIFNLNAWLLLFYVTLMLHFFSETPIVVSKSIGLLLLILATSSQLIISIKRKSILLAGIGLVLLSIIAVVSDSTHIMLSLTVVISLVSVVFLYRFNWIRLIYLSIFLTYLITLIWFMNNPFMGNQLQAITDHQYGFIYLIAAATIFSLVGLAKTSESYSSTGIVSTIIFNGFAFSMLLILLTISFFKDNYVLLIGFVSVFSLFYSVVLQMKSNWKITAALYALYSFVTFSITVYGIYDFPRAYFLLAIQSVVVVIMAIWFRSRFIVGMNTFLFILLLIFYLQTSELINGINISFSLAALLTARILFWKQDQLNIKTDILRNIYLFIGIIMVLITLYHLMPSRYITLSWTAVAVVFFGLSMILKNVKYRYMALGTMMAAAVYLFLVDLAKIELVFRIIALMFLAVISIGLSIYYSRKSKMKKEGD